MEQAQNNSTPGGSQTQAPSLSVSAEIDRIMADPIYKDGKRGDPAHDRLVDRMLELRGMEAVEESSPQSGSTRRTDTSDHIGARDNLAPDPTQARPSMDAALPDAMTVEAKRAWIAGAAEVNMGARELTEVARLALEFRNDKGHYAYEQGNEALNAQFGAKAPEMLRQAKEYLRAYPGLQQWIEARGLGNHPGVIKVLSDRMTAREATEREIERLRQEPEFVAQVPRDHTRARQISERIMALQASLYE